MLVLSTDSLVGYGLNRIFSFVKRAGYDGIDLSIDPANYDTHNTVYIKKLEERFGIPVVCVQAPQNTTKHGILRTVEIAEQVGATIVIVQPPKIFQLKLATWMRTDIPRIRKRESISIALENASGKTILGIIPEYGMNNLNELKNFRHACIDTSRLYEKKVDLIRAYNRLKQYLVHIHLSNVKHGKGYQLPTDGILPLESLLTKLRQDKFEGSISIKVKPAYLQVGNDRKVLDNLIETREFIEKYFVGSDRKRTAT